jgi:hypothetical protein
MGEVSRRLGRYDQCYECLFSCQEYNVHGDDLLQSIFPTVPLSNVMKFEGIANRDSLPYAKTYGLGPVGALDTVLRGTLRWVLSPHVSSLPC